MIGFVETMAVFGQAAETGIQDKYETNIWLINELIVPLQILYILHSSCRNSYVMSYQKKKKVREETNKQTKKPNKQTKKLSNSVWEMC